MKMVEREIEISEIKTLLNVYDNILIESPDGWVKIKDYVEKPKKKIFKLTTRDFSLKCSFDHLIETEDDWKLTEDLLKYNGKILTKNGFQNFILEDLNYEEEVVDLSIDHKNHRYYTEGISSHNTNVGKTLAMCSLATGIVLNNRNVLYVTFEDSEEKIAQRITYNLLDKSKFQLLTMNKEIFKREFEKAKEKVQNRLMIKEFPEYSANANTIEAYLKELNLKKKFKPDIIFIDYIGCMVPNGKANLNINSNEILRQVAGQTRAIGMRHAIPIVSGTQTTRGGSILSEIDLTDVADSFGQTMKADVIFAITEPPELASNGMFAFQILKNRFGTKGHKFFVGVDKFKQRLFNVENNNNAKQDVDSVVSNMLNNTNTKKVVLFD